MTADNAVGERGTALAPSARRWLPHGVFDVYLPVEEPLKVHGRTWQERRRWPHLLVPKRSPEFFTDRPGDLFGDEIRYTAVIDPAAWWRERLAMPPPFKATPFVEKTIALEKPEEGFVEYWGLVGPRVVSRVRSQWPPPSWRERLKDWWWERKSVVAGWLWNLSKAIREARRQNLRNLKEREKAWL